MAFSGSPAGSIQYNLQHSPDHAAYGGDVQGDLKIGRFNYVHAAGSGTGEINLLRLPPGKLVIFSDLSRIQTSVMAANADLHLGYRAHHRSDGTLVAEDDNAFVDNLDVTSVPLDLPFALPAGGVLELDSEAGVTLFAMIDTGNIDNTNTIAGWVTFSRVGS